MKFMMEIDLEAVDGHHERVAYLLAQIAGTLASGAWDVDLRRQTSDGGPRTAEVVNERHQTMARASIVDEAFDTRQLIAHPAAMAPLNDPLNTTPIPKATLQ